MVSFFQSAGIVFLYYIVMASAALLLRKLTRIPDEVFRKLLHFILLGSFPLFVFGFETWHGSALFAVAFAAVVYPILKLFEKLKAYSEFVTERKKGELKSSLLIVFFMFAVVIGVCNGWLREPYLALASVYAWGIGDAFAALVGKRFGRHKLNLKFTDGKKSAEGSAVMFLSSFVSVAIILAVRGGISPLGYVVIPSVVALVSTASELYASGGMDTVICPVCAMSVLIPSVYLFGGIG